MISEAKLCEANNRPNKGCIFSRYFFAPLSNQKLIKYFPKSDRALVLINKKIQKMPKIQIVILLCIITFYSCNGYEEKYNKENKENTNGVDYSIPVNVKFLMKISHGNFLETYYTVNISKDTLNENQVSMIDSFVYRIADSLSKEGFEGASIVIMKETAYTNKLKRNPGITDSMNPFEQNNVYLLKYGYDQKHLISKVINPSSDKGSNTLK